MVMSEQTPLRFPRRGATPGSARLRRVGRSRCRRRPGSPYRLDLAAVLPAESGRSAPPALTFHLLGDVGGVKAPQDQQIVALNLAADAHRARPGPVRLPDG